MIVACDHLIVPCMHMIVACDHVIVPCRHWDALLKRSWLLLAFLLVANEAVQALWSDLAADAADTEDFILRALSHRWR